ncbi:MAG TPA: hypothetical protein QF646_05435, partial [Candidatus Poseidoniales archaeon]|nr:hypothetical protein [Candidatus Poseidoniales archaeon]
KGIRLTIEPGVKVYMNTTNSSITVHGELHAEGNVSNPILIGVNPTLSRTCSSGYWEGIKSNRPFSGDLALVLRNITLEGTLRGSNCGGYDLLNTDYFGRSPSTKNVLDNVTMHTAYRVYFVSDHYQANWFIQNLTFHNLSRFYFRENSFSNFCTTDWRGQVKIRDVIDDVQIDNIAYFSTSTATNPPWCHTYGVSQANDWTFMNASVRLQAGSFWNGNPVASKPTGYSAKFIDSTVKLAGSSSMTDYMHLNDSTFTATKAPRSTWNGYFIDSIDYGKWKITNNSFTPTNGWKNLRYTYAIGHLGAPYNWWGSNNTTAIDANISDYLDNNGGGWVNYTPYWKDSSQSAAWWNGTSPGNLPLSRTPSGTIIFNKTMIKADSPYYLNGPLTISKGIRLTIEPGVKVYMNTTNSSFTVHG